MHSERERDTLREIQRQLLIQNHGAVRIAHAAPGRSPNDHWRQLYTTAVLVAVALIVLMLVGPNALTYKDIATRRKSPAPRRLSTAAPPGKGLAASPSRRWRTPTAAA